MSYFTFSLKVTFPKTCTSVSVSDGSHTYSVPSGSLASGQYTFTLRTPGTWSATGIVPYTYVPETSNGEGSLAKGTAQNTTKTMKSDSANGTVSGTSATLPLKLYVYNGSLGKTGATGANACPDITTKWDHQGNGNTTTYESNRIYSVASGAYGRNFPWGFVDIKPFSKIYIDIICSRVDQTPKFTVSSLNTSQRYHWTGTTLVTVSLTGTSSRKVVSGDVSSVNDQCLLLVDTPYVTKSIYNVWLE